MTTITAETLPMILEAHRSESRSYTDSAVSNLETRLNREMDQRLEQLELRLTGAMTKQQDAHDVEMRSIGTKLDTLTVDIGSVKAGFDAWETQLEGAVGLHHLVRETQLMQAAQSEALTTLQSDIYGTPARGRQTIFGLIGELTTAVSKLTDKVDASALWIEAETQRQAEARQRWANRQQAALAIVKMIPSQIWVGLMAGAGAAVVIIIKSIGG